MKQKITGFTLIEMAIFLGISAIAIFGVLRLLDFVSRNTVSVQRQSLAVETVNRCLQWFIGNRYFNGYASTTCPSTSVPTFCQAPTGYALTVNVACTSLFGSATSVYKTVTISVTGNAKASASIILANYT